MGASPMREMIQRFSVGGIEVKRGDGHRAGKNRSVIGIRSDIFVDALLEQPVVSPTARIFAFAKLVTSNFLRLPSEFLRHQSTARGRSR